MLPPSEEAAAASEEPSCRVALERMAALVEGAREQRSGLADGYALLQELQDEDAPVNTVVFNALLCMAVALAEHGDAGTFDGEGWQPRWRHRWKRCGHAADTKKTAGITAVLVL